MHSANVSWDWNLGLCYILSLLHRRLTQIQVPFSSPRKRQEKVEMHCLKPQSLCLLTTLAAAPRPQGISR